MALTLTYKVTSLKVKDEVNSEGVTLQNAVCQTYWEVTGEDALGNIATWSGATPFSAATVPAANFKDFADLQEEDVLGWITAVVEGDANYEAHIREQLQKRIDEQKRTDVDLPWATPAVTPEAPADPSEDPTLA